MTKQLTRWLLATFVMILLLVSLSAMQSNRLAELESRIQILEDQGYDLNINLMAPEPGTWEVVEPEPITEAA